MPLSGAIAIILALLLVICAGEALYVWVIQPWVDEYRVRRSHPRWFA